MFDLRGRLYLAMLPGGSYACIAIFVPLPPMIAVGEKSIFLGDMYQGPADWPSPLFCK